MEHALKAAEKNPKLKNLYGAVVMKNGSVIAEKYYNGWEREEPVNIKSAAKSILSALIGIAIKDGTLSGLDFPVASAFPQFIGKEEKLKKMITLKHLLTMTSGLESMSKKNFYGWSQSIDPLKDAIKAKMLYSPGSKYSYSTSDSHILAGLLAQYCGKDLLDYAKEKLFTPLEIECVKWEKSRTGQYWGGSNLYLKAYDLAKIGQLFLNGGRWKGKQVVPPQWVVQSTLKQVAPKLWSPFPLEGYGYLWWLISIDGKHAFAAWGHGGQYLIVIPAKKIVLAVVSDWNAGYSKPYYYELAVFIKSILKNVQ
ncbi:MAG: hypothetical protein A2Y33_05175 [Spirochaetes bacterium GWF1_51_8]|nr:MAG: hypothetical protein A2Y33_05175 [Spirochaetes bacterium GWF1_51_8]